MDAPRRLTDIEADRKLRDLFAQTGPLHAPDDMEARVLDQLVARPTARPVEDRPLIANWIWVALGALLLGSILYSLLAPTGVGTTESLYQRYLPNLSLPHLSGFLRTSWALMGLACAAAFLSLEAYLFRPQAVRTDH